MREEPLEFVCLFVLVCSVSGIICCSLVFLGFVLTQLLYLKKKIEAVFFIALGFSSTCAPSPPCQRPSGSWGGGGVLYSIVQASC